MCWLWLRWNHTQKKNIWKAKIKASLNHFRMISRFTFIFYLIVFIALSLFCLSVHLTKTNSLSMVTINWCPRYIFTNHFRLTNMLNIQKFSKRALELAGWVRFFSKHGHLAEDCNHWCLRHASNWANYSVNLISTAIRNFYWQ